MTLALMCLHVVRDHEGFCYFCSMHETEQCYWEMSKWLPAQREASFTEANAVSRGREAPFTGVNDILFNTII